MLVRRPTAADAPAIARAHVRAWQVAYDRIMPASYLDGLVVEVSSQRWLKWFAEPSNQILVVESDGAVVGFCYFGETRDRGAGPEVGEIRAINLDPEHWRLGLGTDLLTASLADLRRAGFRVATLWVLTANERARRFYEKQGWCADGATKEEGPPGCPPLEHLRYRIELGETSS